MMRERGFVLIHALVLLVIAAGLSATLLTRARTLDAAAEQDRVHLRAVHAAEGGLAKAHHALEADPHYAGETLRIGACDVEIAIGTSHKGRSITVTARPGGYRVVDSAPE